MDKHSEQMKNSVRAELGRRAKEMKISHVSRTRVCHKYFHEAEQRDLIMKNVGDKDDSKAGRSGMNFV